MIMGLDFSKTAVQANAASQNNTAKELPEEKQNYDIQKDREILTGRLVNSDEIDQLVSTIKLDNPNTIASFGCEAAEKISKVADVVLNNVNMSQLDETGSLLKSLAVIMEKFDIGEVKADEEKPGFFDKLLGRDKNSVDKLISKYNTMGEEVENIYIQLKKYESDIKKSNISLEDMFDANVEYYHQLVKYILAGEQACSEMDSYIEKRRMDMQMSGDTSINFELQALEQSKMMLEQRTQDLRAAESVAIQSVPMIQTMEFSNMNLIRKINSAFIVTLPVFKQAIAQAVMLKRQKVQADAMSVLDAKTNEMLLRNAQSTVEQAKSVTALSAGSSINIETLENTWNIIVSGIEETKQIQQEAKAQRESDKARLESIKAEFIKMYQNNNG